MSISQIFERIRRVQDQHKLLAYVWNLALSLIMLSGFWILIQYGADDDRYFWLGIGMVIAAGLIMLPAILPRE